MTKNPRSQAGARLITGSNFKNETGNKEEDGRTLSLVLVDGEAIRSLRLFFVSAIKIDVLNSLGQVIAHPFPVVSVILCYLFFISSV